MSIFMKSSFIKTCVWCMSMNDNSNDQNSVKAVY